MKAVVAISRKATVADALNASGHCLLALGQGQKIDGRMFKSQDGVGFGFLIDQPLICLSARSASHLREFHTALREAGLPANCFLDLMKHGMPSEQFEAVSKNHSTNFDYVAVATFGPGEVIDAMTRRFSLVRGSDFREPTSEHLAA